MTTYWPLPRIEVRGLDTVREDRPVAVLTGRASWAAASTLLDLPIVVQAEPHTARLDYLDTLADGLPSEVACVYGVGGGLAADAAKYVGWKRGLPVTVVPTALSVDGLMTGLVAARMDGVVNYVDTGPAENLIIDWDVIAAAPQRVRGAAIVELLTIVTGLLDWRYAAERNRNTERTRFQPWAAAVAAAIAQQAFRIAEGVGAGRVEALRSLLDLVCMEVQLTNQLGHNRPQEGSEQYIAYAAEPRVNPNGRAVPYADLVGPGILLAGALHNQNVDAIRDTLLSAGIRLGQVSPDVIHDTLRDMRDYVARHNLPYGILNDYTYNADDAQRLLQSTRLA